MNARHAFALAFGLALAAPAAAQEETWAISGTARYVARYEGHRLSGTIPFAVTATLAADGTYEVTAPVCATGGTPVLTGRWTRGSNRALRTIIRDGIHANLTSCGIDGVRVRDLSVRQRTAPDGRSITGGFTALVRYRYDVGDEIEAIRARVRGEYTGTRTDP
jgi:hypothetical protein